MNPYLIDQLAEDRWKQLHALSAPRRRHEHSRASIAARRAIGRALIAAGSALAQPRATAATTC